MFPGRIGAIRRTFAARSKERLGMKPKGEALTKDEVELEMLKREKLELITDFDVYENTS